MSFGEHTRYIFGDEEQRLFVVQNTDVFVKQLPAGVVDAFQRAGFAPRLARRTADYAGDIVGECG